MKGLQPSIQRKMTLTASAVSAVLLLIAGSVLLQQLQKIGMKRIDGELAALAEVQLRSWHPRGHWKQFNETLTIIHGDSEGLNYIIDVMGVDRSELYRSPHWPEGLALPRENRVPDWVGDEGKRVNDPVDVSLSERERRLRRSLMPENVTNPRFITLEKEGVTWRVVQMSNRFVTLSVGMNLESYFKETSAYKRTLWIATLIMQVVISLIGAWLALRALKPIRLMTRTLKTITAKGLDKRIPHTNADWELMELIGVINEMLDRLENTYRQAIRFSADASHELKTPLTILQGSLDARIRSAPTGSEEQQSYAELLEEVQRLKHIVEKLLLLSRADSGRLTLALKTVDLTGLVCDLAEEVTILKPELDIRRSIERDLFVEADDILLRQAIQNVLMNAAKYNQPDGFIDISLTRDGGQVCLTVANSGPPISEELAQRMFQRFYRGDMARARAVDGVGLGLSLSREIIRAHGGRLLFDESVNGVNRFSIRL